VYNVSSRYPGVGWGARIFVARHHKHSTHTCSQSMVENTKSEAHNYLKPNGFFYGVLLCFFPCSLSMEKSIHHSFVSLNNDE